MSCAEIRGLLPDHVVGSLSAMDARRVDRHVSRCAGCREERRALEEAMTAVALSLPPVDPPPNLGERIVGRVAAATAGGPGSARGVRALAAATMAAVLVAVGALGWAMAERGQNDLVRRQQVQNVRQLTKALEAVGARPYRADLLPARQERKGFGSVAIYSATRVNDFILVGVVLPDDNAPPYTVKAMDPKGKVLSRGILSKTNNGDWVFYESTVANLSRAISVSVMDRSGRAVMVGSIRPATAE
ncbi:MAG TPA: zf-HC2 domain-containing protein [Actinomycetota bacterium]|nr:zf-HC2 domain-containing protein [Actinomycetota bacterium]